jgi:hypothetical protein
MAKKDTDPLHQYHHELNTFGFKEPFLDFRLSEGGTQGIKHILHEFRFIAFRRIFTSILLDAEV